MKENQIVDGKLELREDTQIVFKKQFSNHGEQYFTALKNDAKTYYIFDLKNTTDGYSLDVIEASRNIDKEVKVLNSTTYKLEDNWMKSHLLVMTDILSSKKENIGIIFHPENNKIGDVLKGEAIVGKKLQATLMNFLQATAGVKNLIIYNDPYVLNAVFPPVISDQAQDREQSLITGIKILAQDGYKLGDNPIVENRFKLPKDKKDDIGEIQKKYFGELIKLQFKNEEIITDNNLKQVSVNDKITKMRQKLESQGIKLK